MVPPKIIRTGPSDLVVREGDNVSMACDAHGYPVPHIIWRREDSEDIIVHGGKKVILLNILFQFKIRNVQ